MTGSHESSFNMSAFLGSDRSMGDICSSSLEDIKLRRRAKKARAVDTITGQASMPIKRPPSVQSNGSSRSSASGRNLHTSRAMQHTVSEKSFNSTGSLTFDMGEDSIHHADFTPPQISIPRTRPHASLSPHSTAIMGKPASLKVPSLSEAFHKYCLEETTSYTEEQDTTTLSARSTRFRSRQTNSGTQKAAPVQYTSVDMAPAPEEANARNTRLRSKHVDSGTQKPASVPYISVDKVHALPEGNTGNTRFRSRRVDSGTQEHASVPYVSIDKMPSREEETVGDTRVRSRRVDSGTQKHASAPSTSTDQAPVRGQEYARNTRLQSSRIDSGVQKQASVPYTSVDMAPIPEEEKALYSSLQLLKGQVERSETERSRMEVQAQQYEDIIATLRGELAAALRRPDSALGHEDDEVAVAELKSDNRRLASAIESMSKQNAYLSKERDDSLVKLAKAGAHIESLESRVAALEKTQTHVAKVQDRVLPQAIPHSQPPCQDADSTLLSLQDPEEVFKLRQKLELEHIRRHRKVPEPVTTDMPTMSLSDLSIDSLDIDDTDVTVRPTQPPAVALASVKKSLEDEILHMKRKLAATQEMYVHFTPGRSKRRREAVGLQINRLVAEIEKRSDQVYALEDVIIGQEQEASRARDIGLEPEDITEEMMECTLSSLGIDIHAPLMHQT